MILNTAYKVQTDILTDDYRQTLAIEDGAIVQTESGYWVIKDGAWVNLNSSDAQGLGWVRYDDGEYTSSNKLTIPQGETITLPNNAAQTFNYLNAPSQFYNSSTKRVYGLKENDTYVCTIVFKMSAANANATYAEVKLSGGNGTPYDRLASTITFPKGNNVEHAYHNIFQYYTDADFIQNGNFWTITATGGAVQIWDCIMFIQRTQAR